MILDDAAMASISNSHAIPNNNAHIEICEEVKGIAVEAGQLVLSAWGKTKHFDSKNDNGTDLVTRTDKQVEQVVLERLKLLFPLHKFLGEEGSGSGQIVLDDSPTWVVDPIDGTTNFVHKYHHLCPLIPSMDNTAVSIALCTHKRAIIGVIYNPIRRELFWAVQGQGAYLKSADRDCTTLHTSSVTDLHQALVCVEYGAAYGDKLRIDKKICNEVRPLLEYPVHGVRSLGAATMNLMAVARGSADAYIESGLKPWDMAAGELIVREAGGSVSMIGHAPPAFTLTGEQIIAACNHDINQQLLRVLGGPSLNAH